MPSPLSVVSNIFTVTSTAFFDDLILRMRSSQDDKKSILDLVISTLPLELPPLYPPPSPPVGILNFGNTCYLSTVLMCLAYIPSIYEHVTSPSFSNVDLKNLFFQLRWSSTPIDATSFYEDFVRLSSFNDDDSSLFDVKAMGDAFNTYLKLTELFGEDRSTLFGGMMHHTIATTTKTKPFTYISLPVLPVADFSQTLASQLDSSITASDGTTLKRKISTPPKNLLVVHLKRFVFNPISQTKTKITAPFPPPLTLQLSRTTYKLRSFIAHTGSAISGHFIR